MKKIMFTTFLLIQTILFAAQTEKPDYKAYILGDSQGKIYLKNNENEKLPLASVTKMMNIMVVFDEINKGNISLDDEVVIDWESVSVGGSSILMKSDDVFILRDLIKAASIKSANNAAYAIAKHAGKGNVNNFISKMNEKAKALGLENELDFYTPTGLPAHMTKKQMDIGTARGVYELSREAIKYKEYMQYASLPKDTVKNGEISLKSTNHLLGKDGIYGIKTGYHAKSGFNIATVSNKEGIDTIVVVLGGKSTKIRDEKILSLEENFHEKYKSKNVVSKSVPVIKIPVQNGIKDYIEVYPENNYVSIVSEDSDVKLQLERVPALVAPVQAGLIVGEYGIYIDGNKVFSDNLIVKENIQKKSIVDILKNKFKKQK